MRAGRGRRVFTVAFAVFALLLQSLAPLEIMPPPGQAVHFAHAHHEHRASKNSGEHSPRPDTPSCPVCQALQAGGTSIAAAAILLAVVDFVYAEAPPPRRIEAPAAPTLPRARARAPPLSV